MTYQGDYIQKVDRDDCGCTSCRIPAFERPRYFPGQLLSDEDLAAEQRYQREKNKLHNRYLHGWGVVCGLEVICNPKCSSKGNVIVKEGYAIDCCGNDIVVCKDEPLNIIEMIERCKPKPEYDDCLTETAPSNDGCEDIEKKYCLILKYKEEEARPVTALKKDDQGCSVKRCEPSRIRETYEFKVKECKECYSPAMRELSDVDISYEEVLKAQSLNQMNGGIYTFRKECLARFKRYSDILNNAFDDYAKIPDYEKLLGVLCNIKHKILSDITKKSSLANCKITGLLKSISFPKPEEYDMKKDFAAVRESSVLIKDILHRLMIDCFCQKLLYPCPECSKDDEVVIACITVKDNGISSICNISRRQVMSFPKLFYWLPLNEHFWNQAVSMCCEEEPSHFDPGVIANPVTDLAANIAKNMAVPQSELNALSAEVETLKMTSGIVPNIGNIVKGVANYNSGLTNEMAKDLAREVPVESIDGIANDTLKEWKQKGIQTLGDILEKTAEVPVNYADAIAVRKHIEKIAIGVDSELMEKGVEKENDIKKIVDRDLMEKLSGEGVSIDLAKIKSVVGKRRVK